MAKTIKQKFTRKPQYEKIAEAYGFNLNENLIGFKFETVNQSVAFHFALMDSHLTYAMYDGTTESVKVKILTHKNNIDAIKALAEVYNGDYYRPTQLNDYE